MSNRRILRLEGQRSQRREYWTFLIVAASPVALLAAGCGSAATFPVGRWGMESGLASMTNEFNEDGTWACREQGGAAPITGAYDTDGDKNIFEEVRAGG